MRQWPALEPETEQYLSQAIAPLLRLVWTGSLAELQFRVTCERIAMAWLSGDKAEVNASAVRAREMIESLADNINEVKAVADQRAWVLSDGFWTRLDLERLDMMQETFAPLMRFRRREQVRPVKLNLPDQIGQRHWIIYGPSGEGAFADSYREKVEARVRTLAGRLPALMQLKRGGALSDDDIEQIATALNQADLFVTEDTLREVYRQPSSSLPDLMRHILGVARLPSQEETIKLAFDRFIAEHGYMSASQINFLRAVRASALRRRRLSREHLLKPPLSRLGAADNLFTPNEVDEIIDFANRLVDRAA